MRTTEAKLAAIVDWLERNQPDVFERGLWDAIVGDQKPSQAEPADEKPKTPFPPDWEE